MCFLMWSETVFVINLQTLKSIGYLKVQHKKMRHFYFYNSKIFLERGMAPFSLLSLCVPSICPL